MISWAKANQIDGYYMVDWRYAQRSTELFLYSCITCFYSIVFEAFLKNKIMQTF